MLQPWIYLVIVVCGIFLKFYKIDDRHFWFDEVATIMHTSGANYNDVLPVNELKNISNYHNLLEVNKQHISIKSQLKGIWNSTNLNPLHYGILVFWIRLVGDKDIHYRYFNVFIFLLTLPLLFKLAEFLFKSNLAGYIAIALFSVNSFFQYYTFEARYNILCIFLVILNQYTFLKATNSGSYKWWTGYALSGILCWYSSLNLGLIFIGHFIYVLVAERKVIIPYIIASAFILAAYFPWLVSISESFDEISVALAWHGWFGNHNFFSLLFAQFYFAAYAFLILSDPFTQMVNFPTHLLQGNYIQLIAVLLMIGLIIFSIVYTCKRGSNKQFIFIVLIVLPQSLFFLISDLIRNTGISLIPRYNILIIIGFMLFLVFLFKEKITKGSTVFRSLFVGLAVLSIISCFYIANSTVSLLKKDTANASFLSKQEKPLLISDMQTVYMPGSVAGILAFTNACKTHKVDILLVRPDIQNISDYFDSNNYSNIFVLHGSQALINNLKLQLANRMDSLEVDGLVNEWQIKNNQ